MTGRAILRLSPIALVLVAAACGGGGGSKSTSSAPPPPPPPPSTTSPADTTKLRVYFLLNGKVQPVERRVPKTKAVAAAALGALLGGPTKDEASLGLTSSMPSKGGWTLGLAGNGLLTLSLPTLESSGLPQVVYTLTQFPDRTKVAVNGKTYTRADFEDETPIILVEQPLPFQTVHSPLRVTGTANTFEATFQYELTDAAGKVIAKHFVTATSGTGVRGTYDVTIPYTVSKPGQGTLAVYENSAANGARIHEVDIPLDLEP